jgi:hypothetical protein
MARFIFPLGAPAESSKIKMWVDVLNSIGGTTKPKRLILGLYSREAAFLSEGVAET